jgi:subtilisin family serine protease
MERQCKNVTNRHNVKKLTAMLAMTALLISSAFIIAIPLQPVNAQTTTAGNTTPFGNGTLFTEEGGDVIPGQYIVTLKNETERASEFGALEGFRTDAAVESLTEDLNRTGAEITATFNQTIDGFVVRIPNQTDAGGFGAAEATFDTLGTLLRSPLVKFVEKDRVVTAFQETVPTGIDRADADMSPIADINRENILNLNVDVAVLDTGIDLDNPDLNVYREKTFVNGTTSADDDNGHGTHVAGTIAAKDNFAGVVGMAPGANQLQNPPIEFKSGRLWALKVLDGTGSGALSDIIKAVEYVTKNANQIDVVNVSLGCNNCQTAALDQAIRESVARGVTYVVAAGNNGQSADTFSPANHPDVITVSAIADSDGKCGGMGPDTSWGPDDLLAPFSNFGSAVDIAAPGVDVNSTIPGGGFDTASGTSMASPHVAGAAALLLATNPALSPLEVRNLLIGTGSTPNTVCDGNGHGYFDGDFDGVNEPLLYTKEY